MDLRIPSGPLRLDAHLAEPSAAQRPAAGSPAVVLCHGFPDAGGGAANAAATLPELADRIAAELGWFALAFAFRGAGESDGQFGIEGWLEDAAAAVRCAREQTAVQGVWIVGFGTGGAIAICAAARDPLIKGVAALGTPADFDDWASQPRRLLEHARDIELVTDPTFPPSFDAWSRELRNNRAERCVEVVAPRPLLVVHGSDDESVPDLDARALADAHGDAELRIIRGARHLLRHDPRAIAVLLGWLDRQRHALKP